MLPPKLSILGLFFFVLMNSIDVNNAVALASHASEKERPVTSQQSNARRSTRKIAQELPKKTQKLKTAVPTESKNKKSTISNSNVNVNEVYAAGLIKSEWQHPISHQGDSLISDISNDSDFESDNEEDLGSTGDDNDANAESEEQEIVEIEKEETADCSRERQNQRAHQNSPTKKSSADFTNAFKVPSATEAKKTSSVHSGEDITLCWIETTTIKEDPDYDPPMRLVVREFTISFENSAAIPDNYLECTKMAGEVVTGDVEAVCDSSLNEVIVENTMRSRIGNFGSVSHVGPTIVRQQKTVRCATGGTVSKDIYEWPDNSKNPRKRVELKVGPSIREVVASDGDKGECKIKPILTESAEDLDQSSASVCTSGESCEKSVECENGEECNEPKNASSCEDGLCVSDSPIEDSIVTTLSPESTDSTVGTSTRTTTRKPKPMNSKEDHQCSEFDTECQVTEINTKPENGTENGEICSGEKCSGEPSDGSANPDSSDERQDSSESCVDGDCDKEKSSSTEEDKFDGNTLVSGESCQNNSETCTCNGTSCLIENNTESDVLTTVDELTDETTVNSVPETNRTTLNDSVCDSETGFCRGSSETSLDEEKKMDITTSDSNDATVEISTTHNEEVSTLEDTNDESEIDEIGKTESSDETSTTEVPGLDLVTVGTVTPRPCDDGESGGCLTVATEGEELLDESTEKTEESSSTTESSSATESENISTCAEDSTDKKCQSTGTTSESKVKDDDVTTDSSSQVSHSEDIFSETPESSENIMSSDDNAVTSIPVTSKDSVTPMIDVLSKSTDDESLSDEASSDKYPVTKCSLDSEDGHCDEKEVISSTAVPEKTTVASEFCESAGNCKSTDEILDSAETDQRTSVNSSGSSENSTQSICDVSTGSCENSSSGNSSEICGGDSSSGDCENKSSTSEPCDSSSDSCLSESSTSTGLTDKSTSTKSTKQKATDLSTTTEDIPTIGVTRESIGPSSFTSTPTKGSHKLALKIKVLLEHVNENKEKEKLVQVEKHLLLNESLEDHDNHSLIWQIRSLNDSINMETFRSIFNCSGLENFTENFSNLTEFKLKLGDKASSRKKKGNPSVDVLTIETENETENSSSERSNESMSRKKRDTLDSKNNGVTENNLNDTAREKAIRGSQLGVNEDFQEGLKHILHLLAQEFDLPMTSESTKPSETSTSKILEILADPGDGRVHSSRQRRANKLRVESIEELQKPVNGGEIDRWSNERFIETADGGRVRSLLEFELLKDPVEKSRGISSGS